MSVIFKNVTQTRNGAISILNLGDLEVCASFLIIMSYVFTEQLILKVCNLKIQQSSGLRKIVSVTQ